MNTHDYELGSPQSIHRLEREISEAKQAAMRCIHKQVLLLRDPEGFNRERFEERRAEWNDIGESLLAKSLGLSNQYAVALPLPPKLRRKSTV